MNNKIRVTARVFNEAIKLENPDNYKYPKMLEAARIVSEYFGLEDGIENATRASQLVFELEELLND